MNFKQLTFEEIEDLKREWTEKYVEVDAARPELKRFGGRAGRVVTVNMSGRALVQFDDADGWGWGRYDIALPFLKRVPKPVQAEKTEKAEKSEAMKAAADKAKPEGVAAAEAKPPGAKLSPLEIMRAKAAAAKAGGETGPAKPAEGEAPAKPSKLDLIRQAAAKKKAENPPSS